MARPLRLALITVLVCAGAAAAPVWTHPGHASLVATKPVPTPVPNESFFWVDRASGCVWQISTATGYRKLASHPCPGMKRKHNYTAPQTELDGEAPPSILPPRRP